MCRQNRECFLPPPSCCHSLPRPLPTRVEREEHHSQVRVLGLSRTPLQTQMQAPMRLSPAAGQYTARPTRVPRHSTRIPPCPAPTPPPSDSGSRLLTNPPRPHTPAKTTLCKSFLAFTPRFSTRHAHLPNPNHPPPAPPALASVEDLDSILNPDKLTLHRVSNGNPCGKLVHESRA